jgi:molecular chaperone DnaJ
VDYYAILGVDEDVDPDTLKSVYRQLARTFHPDVNADTGSVEHFRRITEAYQVLSDPERRAHFDRARRRHAQVRRRQIGTETEGEGSLRIAGLDLGGLVGVSVRLRTRPLFDDELDEDEQPLSARWPLDPHLP